MTEKQPSEKPLFTVAQVRELDRRAISTHGVTGYDLMRRAAMAALASLRRHWPQARRLAVYCGPGNNGGDGFLFGALAREAGLEVEVFALADSAHGDAAEARRIYENGQASAHRFVSEPLSAADVYVDAIYGTGLSRPPEPRIAELIEALNRSGRPILALDVPSGLDADNGRCLGIAVRATVTVSFIAAKRGLHTGQAADQVGVLEYDSLGLPPSLLDEQMPDAHLLAEEHLPQRPRAAHKGSNGHLLIVGGDHGTAGAIHLCGAAALRIGAGLVSVATHAENVGPLNGARPELMARGVNGPQALQPLLDKADVLAVGPGLGQTAWGHALWLTALDAGKPLVLDADGLNLLAREQQPLRAPTVLTPHPGEAARLLGTDVAGIEADRFAAARALAQRYGAVVVLKGVGSLIAAPDGRLKVCPWGNPGMASGGMGDLLTGVIAALLAQQKDAWSAAYLGVGLHARAADLAARRGERGLIASDLLDWLRPLVNGAACE